MKIYIVILLSFAINTPRIFPQSDTALNKIYVVKHGWHTGIIFNKEEAESYLVEFDDIDTRAKYLEFSWGDKDFFYIG